MYIGNLIKIYTPAQYPYLENIRLLHSQFFHVCLIVLISLLGTSRGSTTCSPACPPGSRSILYLPTYIQEMFFMMTSPFHIYIKNYQPYFYYTVSWVACSLWYAHLVTPLPHGLAVLLFYFLLSHFLLVFPI